MVTLEDISLEVGCSVNTVSKALNNKPDVSKEMRRRVLEAAEKLGYIPNTLAKSLVTRQSMTVGIMLPDSTHPLHAGLLEKLVLTMREYNYGALVGISGNDHDRERSEVEHLCQKRIDGLFVAPTAFKFEPVAYLAKVGIPAVFLLNTPDDPAMPFVGPRPEDEARLATMHLLASGCRRPLFLGCDETMDRYFNAYAECLVECGVPMDERLVVRTKPDRDGGNAAVWSLLAAGASFDAVLLTSGRMFGGVHAALAAHGFSCPGDVKAAACRDSWLDECYPVPLTASAVNLEEVVENAAYMLISLIKDKESAVPRRIVVAPRLVIRDSSRA